ncbi:centrin-2 isoform X2 [Solanum tuberosum]|uniref:EF hand family protein n=1 Tax=Solanum tuberosum TaxID=4113 RepID=M1CG76_SOLTU|nr:PREDICTED: centrin-2 isoform X2 [Solanum tuberosum]
MANSNVSDSETEETNSDSEESPAEPQRTGKLTDYEKQRMKRIEENRARMKAMGLHKMATSLMGASPKPEKKGKDRKGKKKVVDEDEDYEPAQSEDEDDDGDFEVSKSQLKKSKKKIQTTQKRVSNTTVPTDMDFVDDDVALMQAIALSLQDSAGFLNLANKVPMQGTDADSTKKDSNEKAVLKKVSNEKASLKMASNEKDVGTCNQEDVTGKRKRKQQARNRVQMTEDDLIMHFFQFDEAGKGSISFRDLQKMVVSHDFTWSDEDLANMIRCFDSNGDGKLSLDDFHKIVVRCNMIQGSEDAG